MATRLIVRLLNAALLGGTAVTAYFHHDARADAKCVQCVAIYTPTGQSTSCLYGATGGSNCIIEAGPGFANCTETGACS